MNTLSSTLALHMAKLQLQLAAALGLPEAMANALFQKASPLMVAALANPSRLGGADAMWDISVQAYLAHTHANLAELTRSDNGWPARRSFWAQALLGTPQFVTLIHEAGATAPDQAGQWLGCLAAVVLATAGQQAAEQHATAATFQHWLQQQVPGGVVTSARPAVAAPAVSGVQPASKTAPWWPLVVLAVVGIGTSSYAWRQQLAAEATAALPAAMRPAFAPIIQLVAPAPVPPTPAVSAAAVAATPNATPAIKPTKLSPAPAKAALALSSDKKFDLKHGVAKAAASAPADSARPVASHSEARADEAGHENNQTASTAQNGAGNSAETQLFKRLTSAESPERLPIDLERIEFEAGQVAINTEGTQQLNNIAILLKTFPRCRLIVMGSAEPTEPRATALALDRANLLVNELVKQGVPNSVLQAQGVLRSNAEKADKADGTTHKRRPALYITSLN